MRILVTGGAGFVGSNIACHLARSIESSRIIVLDNLSRRGSELNLPRLKDRGIEFMKGDIRNPEDFASLPDVDWVIDCSADPSVLSGYGDSPREVIDTNFGGTVHTLEYARKVGARLLFMSTSRVYAIDALNRLHLSAKPNRFELSENQTESGASPAGIAESFSTRGPKSFYGMTKLASEMLIEEYAYGYQMPFIINRCGLLAGPWQMGKIDQGVIAFWVFRFLFGGNLGFIGFGGQGQQVRDFLHIDDLCALILEQIQRPDQFTGRIMNVGGGKTFSCSLRELNDVCAEVTGIKKDVASQPENRTADIPYYASDCRSLFSLTSWRPRRDLRQTVESIVDWAREHRASLRAVLT